MNETALTSGMIRFHQWCEPPLAAGQYRLTAVQEVEEIEATGESAFKSEIAFSVDGPRFGLSPTDIYSVYPPKGQSGEFGGSLPHVVLSRRTLPWERTLVPGPRKDKDKAPWLALLTLAASDFQNGAFPEMITRKLGELIQPGAGGPVLELAPQEHEDDLCATIDLPADVFAAIAPRADELPFLAHVREVNTDAKETASYLGEGWYSVVVGNRMPATGVGDVENRAFLVSLEGLADRLPKENDEPAPPEGSAGSTPKENDKPVTVPTTVRLAVLSSWSFLARPGDPFQGAVDRLETGLLSLIWRADGTKDAAKRINDAFDAGYVPLNHSVRLGERTVSWYRGPLTPIRFEKQESFAFRAVADAALRYDADQGMFDVSYAAAFQLGRLLALQSRQFAQSVTAFRKRVREKVNLVLERERARNTLGQASGSDLAETMRAFLGTVGPSQAARSVYWDEGTPKLAEPEQAKPGELRLDRDFDLSITEPVGRWLARLVLLYRVPFVYLVPDQRMLEPDSIRFFYLDPNWIKCLLEGACSVGRNSPRDELAEQALRGQFLDLALEQAIDVRARPSSNMPGAVSPVEGGARKAPRWPLSGFLMRSRIVEGWQGLEMDAFEASGAFLDPLRIDRLAPDILLCLFNGELSTITVRQPAEGVHFGFKTDGKGALCKEKLRRSLGDQAGDQVEDTKVLAKMRKGSNSVLDVTQLAVAMRDKLGNLRDGDKPFTSAEFALQMIASAGRVKFSPEGQAA